MDKKNSHFSFSLLVLDFVLLNVSFFVMNYWKRGTFELSPIYIKLLIAFYIIWLFVSLFTKKPHLNSYKSYSSALALFTKSTIFIAYCISLFVVMTGMAAFSRVHVFGTFFILFFLEIVIFSIYYVSIGKARIVHIEKADVEVREKRKLSIFLLSSDFLLVTLLFFVMNYYKRGTFNLSPEYEKLLLIVYGLWFLTSFFTNKFDKRNFQNIYYAVAPCLKAIILMTATMSVLVFAFRLFYYSRLHIFGSFLLLIIFELVLYYLYFIFGLNREIIKDIESVDEVKTLLKQKELHLDVDIKEIRSKLTKPIKEELQERYLKPYPWIFNFINKSLDLSKIIKAETAIVNTSDMFHAYLIYDYPIRLLVNLHRVNDIRWINRYFLELQKILVNGGFFIGSAETVNTHRRRFFKKYPRYFREAFYAIHFLLFRVVPKLPGIKKLFFAITKGKNRVISKAEVLGRLYFCGFRVIEEKELENGLYFIAQKVRTPSIDENPSYGPLVKFERLGTNGRPISIYKFRTMHPYSEYLQEYIYGKNRLRRGGKIEDDFRVTGWGKIMRKRWLDELPSLYNWIKGEVKLFGVRPLSPHYMSLYSKELQRLRKKVRPGLIPPYYADLPVTFSEICESEKRYIQTFLENPLKTQWSYFWKAIYNIAIKGARSN